MDDQVLQLARPHQRLRVVGRALLDDAIGDVEVARQGQLGQLVHRGLGLGRVPRGDVDQDRAADLARDLGALAVTVELLLEGADQLEEILVDLRRRTGREQPVARSVGGHVLGLAPGRLRIGLARTRDGGSTRETTPWRSLAPVGPVGFAPWAIRRREQVRDPHPARTTVVVDRDRGQRVEAVQGQRRQLLRAQRRVAEACRDEPQGAETQSSGGGARLARNDHALGAAYGDGLDATGAVDQQADAAVEVVAQAGHLARQLVGDDRARWHAPAKQLLESMFFGGREAE